MPFETAWLIISLATLQIVDPIGNARDGFFLDRSAIIAEPGSAQADAMWFETELGWIVTDERAKAEWAASNLREASSSFEKHFGTAPVKGVIVEARFAGLLDGLPAETRNWVLPWPSTAFGSNESLKVRASSLSHHVDPRSSLRHELGHAFFLATIIGNVRKDQYGGDAPDWLDEAAGLVVETDRVTGIRRAQFSEQVCAGRLVDLNDFLIKEHPLFGAPAMAAAIASARAEASASGTPRMVELSLSELNVSEVQVADFYAQSRAVVDYLIYRTGDQAILGRVAHELKGKGPLEPLSWTKSAWLAQTSPGSNIALTVDFERWAREGFGCEGVDQ